jgi:hypothetical protein
MKFLTILFYDDGRYAGTQGAERLLPDDWQPPTYMLPGDTKPRRFLAVHVGAAEMNGTPKCVSTELSEALEADPASSPAAPRFKVITGKQSPALIDVPCTRSAMDAWLRANGPDKVAQPLRAWLTLTTPEFAATYRLNRGVDLADLVAVERKRLGTIRPEHSRLSSLEFQIQERAKAKRAAIFERQRRAERQRAEAAKPRSQASRAGSSMGDK